MNKTIEEAIRTYNEAKKELSTEEIKQLDTASISASTNTETLCLKIAQDLENNENHHKKILYIDMDGVIVDFESGIKQLDDKTLKQYKGDYDEVPGIFSTMRPIENAISTIESLQDLFDIYILSTASWNNPSAWSDKLVWIKKYLPEVVYKKLILTHNKHLNMGDYLIDDRTKNGADRFTGKLITFDTKDPKNWDNVKDYLHIEYLKNVIKEDQVPQSSN